MLYHPPEIEEAERERQFNGFGPEEQEPTLLDYARIVWEGRWLIAPFVLVATLAAGAYSATLPKSFVATATLMPLGSERGGGLASALSGSLGGALGIESPTDKLVAVLQSRRVAGMVVDDLDLIPILSKGAGRKPTREEVIESVQKSVVKVSGGGRGIISVRAHWREPSITAAMANATVAAAARFLNERSISLNFQILDEAVPPLRPSGPRLLAHVALAFILSLFIAVLVVFVRHAWRTARARERLNKDVSEILRSESPVG